MQRPDALVSRPSKLSGGTGRSDAPPGARERPRVLVVDDDQPTREGLVEALGDEGFTMEAAENGAQAIRIMSAAPPDLVLLDLMMPGMSGWEVIEEMKARPDLRDIPVVVITASRHLGRAPWGYPVLVKPLRVEHLTQSLRALLG